MVIVSLCLLCGLFVCWVGLMIAYGTCTFMISGYCWFVVFIAAVLVVGLLYLVDLIVVMLLMFAAVW